MISFVEAEACLGSARGFEAVFGVPSGVATAWLESAQQTYRRLARAVHPDANGNSVESRALFARLSELWGQAQAAADGTTTSLAVTVGSRDHTYTVGPHIARDDLADAFLCEDESGRPTLLRVAHRLADEDLMRVEVDTLAYLHREAATADAAAVRFLPEPGELFYFDEDGRAELRCASATSVGGELFTLAEVRQAYPSGVDPKDFAWIWRRLLGVLDYAHGKGVVHGAVLPGNVLVSPDHRVVLAGWSYAAVESSGVMPHIPAVDARYRDWYPAGVLAREPAHPGVDLALAARTMMFLLGTDPMADTSSAGVPGGIWVHLNGCMHTRDALLALRSFTALIERMWGRREYHEFTMPSRSVFTYTP